MIAVHKHFLKVGLSPSKKDFFICFNKSPLKMMKHAFYFMLKRKIFSLLGYLHFCHDFFGYVEKRLDNKAND